jgi:DNA invertase Pin-like site-specific DNA recombinase/DNA-binding CsgD family transcriptional regulator
MSLLPQDVVSRRAAREVVPSATSRVAHLTSRQAEVLRLAGRGLSGKQIAHHLGISVRTVEAHFSAMRKRMGARSQAELIAYGVVAGLVKPTVPAGSGREISPGSQSRNRVLPDQLRDGMRGDHLMGIPPPLDNSVRIGYARVSTRAQDHQVQLDTLAAAQCREIIMETASSRNGRPQLLRALETLHAGDTLVIYKPDRVARSVNELLVLLENQLHARGINLHILCGICAGLHRPDGATLADKMLFTVAAMAAEMERDLTRERTLNGSRAAQAEDRRGGRPASVDDDVLAIVRTRREQGETVTAIARHLGIGRSTLYRWLALDDKIRAGEKAEYAMTAHPPRPACPSSSRPPCPRSASGAPRPTR